MPSTKFRRTRSQLMVLGFLTGLLALVALAQRADAQIQQIQRGEGPPITIPSAQLDLEVTVTAPAQIQQQGQESIQVRVANTLTPSSSSPGPLGSGSPLGGSDANGVSVVVRFAGLEPRTVQGNGGLQCGLVGGSGTAPMTSATCTGAIPAGGAATISISVNERGNCQIDCGPVYTDAIVDPGNTITERSETNNRALGVTDVIGCIN